MFRIRPYPGSDRARHPARPRRTPESIGLQQATDDVALVADAVPDRKLADFTALEREPVKIVPFICHFVDPDVVTFAQRAFLAQKVVNRGCDPADDPTLAANGFLVSAAVDDVGMVGNPAMFSAEGEMHHVGARSGVAGFCRFATSVGDPAHDVAIGYGQWQVQPKSVCKSRVSDKSMPFGATI